MNSPNFNIARISAQYFAKSKGIPRDAYEMAEWLLEFNEVLVNMLNHSHQMYTDHLTQCDRLCFLISKLKEEKKP